MRSTRRTIVLGLTVCMTLASTNAWAHWCDDLWSSAYNIILRADSDTSPKELYVENHWGYQLINFKLTATSASGGTVTLTPPTTLKVPGTLLPGERGTWKITAGSPAKIEDLTFHVTFGNTTGSLNKQYACYPVLGGSPVMVIKKDGRREKFERQKVLNGLLKAAEKRPIPMSRLAQIVDEVESRLSENPDRELASAAIGELIMQRLQTLDKIAYVRFASVYRDFQDEEAFLSEITKLMRQKRT